MNIVHLRFPRLPELSESDGGGEGGAPGGPDMGMGGGGSSSTSSSILSSLSSKLEDSKKLVWPVFLPREFVLGGLTFLFGRLLVTWTSFGDSLASCSSSREGFLLGGGAGELGLLGSMYIPPPLSLSIFCSDLILSDILRFFGGDANTTSSKGVGGGLPGRGGGESSPSSDIALLCSKSLF